MTRAQKMEAALNSASELLAELGRTAASNDQADAIDEVQQAINAALSWPKKRRKKVAP